MKTKQHLLLLLLLFMAYSFSGFAQQKKAVVHIQFDNPVKSGQDIRVTLDQNTDLELLLLNKEDKFIKLLLKQELMAGTHDLPIVVSDVPAGDYQLQMTTPDGKETKTFTVVHSPNSSAAISTLPSKPWMTPTVVTNDVIAVLDVKGVGKNYSLSLTNPVKSGDNLTLTVTKLTDFKVTILSKNNKFVQLLMHQELMPGTHDIPMILSDLQAGSYWLNIEAGGETKTQALDIKH